MESFKRCNKCKISKSYLEFTKNKSTKDGFKRYCKSCCKKKDSKNRRTEKGVITAIYSSQKSHSKTRGHFSPKYSKKQLSEWLYHNEFKKLYDNWISNGCEKYLKPSVDRLDDNKGYSFNNIRLVTWGENYKKSQEDSKNAIGTKGIRCRKVNQYDLEGKFIKSFKSIRIASDKSGIKRPNISLCCLGKHKKSGGFIWKYAEK